MLLEIRRKLTERMADQNSDKIYTTYAHIYRVSNWPRIGHFYNFQTAACCGRSCSPDLCWMNSHCIHLPLNPIWGSTAMCVFLIHDRPVPTSILSKHVFKDRLKIERESASRFLILIIIIVNFYSPLSNTRYHSIGHEMRIARFKIRVDNQVRKEPREGTQFWKGVFWAWNRILVESFGYQEGLNSRVVDRWQRKPFCQVMIGHMESKEQVNQKIV